MNVFFNLKFCRAFFPRGIFIAYDKYPLDMMGKTFYIHLCINSVECFTPPALGMSHDLDYVLQIYTREFSVGV
jgi:hypothetical protein